MSGPTCGVMLADYGAEVIKVEHLQTGGDPTRRWIPEIDPSPDLVNYVFEQINRGKRSLALDLGSEKGKEIFARLIKNSDVMVTNLRVGTAESLGIDYESLSAINPALVYGRLTAYGIEGPDKDRPGYDMLSYWARSGLMSAISPAGRAACRPTMFTRRRKHRNFPFRGHNDGALHAGADGQRGRG